MSIIVNKVRRGFYLDSVALMRMSRRLNDLEGVEEAALMMATPANKEILANSQILAADGEAATAGDLVIAIRTKTSDQAQNAVEHAASLLDAPKLSPMSGSNWRPRSLNAAKDKHPETNLALISVPGEFAAAEARKALRAGLHVMIFSDNVSLEQEVELKRQARDQGLLVMGPDCGTAILGGSPLAFANRVPSGSIGMIGASGTGIQEVSSLIARNGQGISHAIGTGGRDLKEEVGGITTLMAFDMLDQESNTQTIVLISKPPAQIVADKILERVAQSSKKVIICFLGCRQLDLPSNAILAPTLKAAAERAIGRDIAASTSISSSAATGPTINGLFCGGTLCAEAQWVLLQSEFKVTSNEPVPGAGSLAYGTHQLVDLGADEYTRGRPHPMIEPGIRDEALLRAIDDQHVGVVLLDLVLGHGAHENPAGFIADIIKAKQPSKPIICSITGTYGDPQDFGQQTSILEQAGVIVASSNQDAASLAADCMRRRN